jgi:phage terminase large subunit GpA-like protein
MRRGEIRAQRGAGIAEVLARLARAARPPDSFDPIDWLEAHRRLSPESSAEDGPFHFSRSHHTLEPERAILGYKYPEVVLSWASQTAKSETATLNPVLFWSVTAPAPMLIVCPDWKTARSLSSDRISPMLRDSRVSETVLEEERSGGPGSDNSLFRKTIGNGMPLTLTVGLSASGLSSKPIRYLVFEEVSRLPLVARGRAIEGDVVQLAKVRCATYWAQRKIIYSSSPIELESCRITALYAESTRSRYFSRCPRGHYQVLRLPEMNFKSAGCKCLECGREYNQEAWQSRPGRWIAENPTHWRAGFWMAAWPSPFVEWPVIFEEWREAVHLKEAGDASLFRGVLGTRLAENYSLKIDVMAEEEALYTRREVYPETLPDGVKVIVASVDTQDDWLAYLILGFGAGRECWALETGTILGRLSVEAADIYRQIDELVLSRSFSRSDGSNMRVKKTLQDAGGSMTTDVLRSARERMNRGLWAYRGGTLSAGLWKLGHSEAPTRYPFVVGDANRLKDLLSGMLSVETAGSGYIHFPAGSDGIDASGFDPEFFGQFAAERKETRIKNGIRSTTWVQIRDRNESIDLFCMALVALESLRLNLGTMKPDLVAETTAPSEQKSQKSPYGVIHQAATGLINFGDEEPYPQHQQQPRKSPYGVQNW